MGGPVEVLLIAAIAITGLVGWLVRDRRYPGPRLLDEEPRIDRNTLDAAEREARDAPASAAVSVRGVASGSDAGPPRP
ncbi:MAG TPA: hypothetical protein VFU46_02890 [Gemmatimonadales bacterium]|nr:hypothetical protein [Gemmatimonadales bacterium]